MKSRGGPAAGRRATLAAVVLASSALAQEGRFTSDPVFPPQQGQGPQGTQSPQSPQGRSGLPSIFGEEPRWRTGFQGLEELVYPKYQGFPSFLVPGGRGFGSYPADPELRGRTTPGLGDWRPPPMSDARERPWPSWLDVEPEPGGPVVTPERALLVRDADSVWFLSPRDNAFVPLEFHDKFRPVEAGAAIEVPNKGALQIAFHDGGRLTSIGPVRLSVRVLDAEVGELAVARFHRLNLTSVLRRFRLELPDGSTLEIAKSTVVLQGDDARGFVLNKGPGRLVWQRSLGEVTIEPGQRVDVFHDRRQRPELTAGFALDGVDMVQEGRVVSVRGEDRGGTVTWSGARIRVPAGAVLRLDALAGQDFPNLR